MIWQLLASWITAAFVIALVACTSQGATEIGGSGGAAELKEITLHDGTRCAVIVGYSKAAISCDWKS